MNLLVLLAGIADPKWPVSGIAVGDDGTDVVTGIPTVLSPFDEAALELALKLRDARPETHITAALMGSPATATLMRHVAGFRPDDTIHVDAIAWPRWDLRQVALCLSSLVDGAQVAPQLILMGREFGDADDGTVAACLAAELHRPYVARIQEIVAGTEAPRLLRESAEGEEQFEVTVPMLASVTNDRRNRLRHPLMKNVMAAKRATLPLRVLPPVQPITRVRLTEAAKAESGRRATQCRKLHGDTSDVVDALGDFLSAWKSAR